ncbi:MAG: radical SAM protein [Lentisphaerae bacterium]|nr:radical SAM protein [Lentisphaerota bacterium]
MRDMNRPLFRPPAEAWSLILQVDRGCPHNRCTFCGMYRGLKHRRLAVDEVRRLIQRESRPDTQRVFLADGDVMRRPFEELRDILLALNELCPGLARVSLYANGSSIAAKTGEQLRTLRSLKLHTLYMGLESGDDDVLERCRKGETAARMVLAGVAAQEAGLRMSVMVLLGLGGAEGSDQHVERTADVLNDMQPRLLSALRVIPVPGTELRTKTWLPAGSAS